MQILQLWGFWLGFLLYFDSTNYTLQGKNISDMWITVEDMTQNNKFTCRVDYYFFLLDKQVIYYMYRYLNILSNVEKAFSFPRTKQCVGRSFLNHVDFCWPSFSQGKFRVVNGHHLHYNVSHSVKYFESHFFAHVMSSNAFSITVPPLLL